METQAASDATDLKRKLVAIDREARLRSVALAVNVVTKGGNSFAIIVGMRNRDSILTFNGLNGDPPYYVSEGNKLADLGMVKYVFGGERSELPASHVIPYVLALKGLIDSIESETPSSKIKWYGG